MRQLFELTRRFRRDERGAFLALFGVMALVLIATTGAVVDFVSVQNARSEAQYALDAAALALQPRIYSDTEEELRVLAQDLVRERMSDPSVTVDVETAQSIVDDGTLFLQAQIDVPMAFVGLVGIEDMTTRIVAQATRKQLHLEVAFVLDNSGSMDWYGRMTNLKTAATCATNIIFYGSCVPAVGAEKADNVKAAIIPFTSLVNIGSGNASASWMDTTGVSSISNDNFDDDDDDSTPFTGAVSRFDLYDQLSNVSWEGCVEARPYPYSTDDTAPTIATPDTLFVPTFAPDNPDGSSSYDNNYLDDTPNSCDVLQGSCTCEKEYIDGYYAWGCGYYGGYGWCSGHWETTCEFTDTDNNVTGASCSCGSFYGSGPVTCDIYYTPPASSLSSREKQERLCKYSGSANLYGHYGPNSDCPSRDILPLTDNTTTILSDITAMVANGATNIHQGVIWGYHALSPTLPFDEGRQYETATAKVMIVMTDGENTYYGSSNMNESDFLQAYGHLWNAPTTSGTPYQATSSRLGYTVNDSSNMPTIMNTLTVETCNNAKAEGIEIYTIGLNSPNTATTTMLQNCSSGSGYAYFPTDASELTSVFTEIANQLAALRLAQ